MKAGHAGPDLAKVSDPDPVSDGPAGHLVRGLLAGLVIALLTTVTRVLVLLDRLTGTRGLWGLTAT
jgi:hypothetical protein